MEKQAQILLVEDDQMDAKLIIDAFEDVKLKDCIHLVHNGQEALDFLFGKGKYTDRTLYTLPDLILLELKMPGIDGFEVLRQVKSANIIKRIPVIILTSSNEEKDLALCYDIGANSYVSKPTSLNNYTDMVRKIDNYWISLNIGAPEAYL